MHKAGEAFLTENTKNNKGKEKSLTFFVENVILMPYKSAQAPIY
jgi:hypothetical protein